MKQTRAVRLFAVTLLLVAIAGSTFGDATTYSSVKRTYKVGVLLIDSTKDVDGDGIVTPAEAVRGAENPDPHLFYIADARTDVKPANWELVNPLAPSTVTPEIKARWDGRHGGIDRSGYQIGQKVTKNMATYWEVSLNRTSETDLLQYDLLFITSHSQIRFSPAEAEKLRKVVDAGGVIWLEDCGGMTVGPANRFFLRNLQFRRANTAGQPVVNQPDHPLLTTPYRLQFDEIANLGDKNYTTYMSDFLPGELTTTNYTAAVGLPPQPEILTNIIGNTAAPGGNQPYVAAGVYGSGAVIATSSDSGCDINDYAGGDNVGSGGNSGAFCGKNIRSAINADLKFLYNSVAWGSVNNTERRNNRRTASALESTGAPLVNRFNTGAFYAGDIAVASRTSPVLYKGILYVTGVEGGQATLRAYDAQPNRDADGDGNPDDGLPDLSTGRPYDELWRINLGGAGAVQPSSPVFATLYSGTAQVEAILVTRPDGGLVAVQSIRFDNSGRILPTAPVLFTNDPVVVGASVYAATPTAPAPTFSEGKIYVAQPDGVVRCVNATSGNTLWTTFSIDPGSVVAPVGAPSVGYTRLTFASNTQEGTTGNLGTGQAAASFGATLDLMLYLPVRQDAGSGNIVASVLPYWLGTRNEVRKSFNGTGVFNTRASESVNAPRYRAVGVAPVRVYDNANGNTREQNYRLGVISTIYSGAFLPDGTVQLSSVPPNQTDVMISVDYDVEYLPSSATNTGTAARNVGSALSIGTYAGGFFGTALSNNDLLIFAGDQTIDPGRTPAPLAPTASLPSVYAANEQSDRTATATKVRWRFQLHDGVDNQPVDTAAVTDPAPLRNVMQFNANWPTANAAIQRNAPETLVDVRIVGSPVVTNTNRTYVLARATSVAYNASRAVTIVMAFKTNYQLTLNMGEPFIGTPTVSQYDPLTGNKVDLGAGQIQVEAATGKIAITSFDSGGGNAASASSSFVVKYTPVGAAAAITKVIPPQGGIYVLDTTNPGVEPGYATPMEWYYVIPGEPVSGLALSGSHLYLTQQRNNAALAIVALDAEPRSTDATAGAGGQILNVVNEITPELISGGFGPTRTVTVNHVPWATETFGGAASLAGAPSAASGSLAVGTNAGTFVFEDAITLIADGKRVLEANTAGEAVWSMDSTARSRVVGGDLPIYNGTGAITNPPANGRLIIERTNLSRPAYARRLSADDYLIADTGNNRVVRTDKAGEERWEMETFADPYNILANGEPTTLSEPTDVQFFLAQTLDPFNGGRVIGYEANYLIADAGNSRIIHVVDFYDRNGVPADAITTTNGSSISRIAGTAGRHILLWTTRTASQEGRRLRYQNLQLSFDRDQATGLTGYPRLSAVVGNSSAAGTGSTATSDYTGGAIVILDYKPYKTTFTLRDNSGAASDFTPWPINVNPRGAEPRGNGLINASADDVVFLNAAGTAADRIVKITRPLYFEQVTVPVPGTTTGATRRVYLICDANGVYEIEPRVIGGKQVRVVTWSFSQADYTAMNLGILAGTNPRLTFPAGFDPTTAPFNSFPGFVPSSVKRLGNGNYLIANTFGGRNPYFDSGQFLGEVFEVTPLKRFAGFSVPRMTGTATGLTRQVMGSSISNTSLLEQPKSADRLF